MYRPKIGDVYAFKTERGYRLIHWAYHIEKQGKFVRVIRGFYTEIPNDICEIVTNECDYIICFDVPKLYRKGLLEIVGSVPTEKVEPFPKYDLNYREYGKDSEIVVCEFYSHQNSERFKSDSTGKGLPEKYRNVKLINAIIDPIWFIYLISSSFDLKHWEFFYPAELWDEYDKKYGDVIFKRQNKKTTKNDFL